jgi:hypothetical protein
LAFIEMLPQQNAPLPPEPRRRDFEGLDPQSLDESVRRSGVFNSKTFDANFSADVATATESVVIFSGFVSNNRVGEIRNMLKRATAGR